MNICDHCSSQGEVAHFSASECEGLGLAWGAGYYCESCVDGGGIPSRKRAGRLFSPGHLDAGQRAQAGRRMGYANRTNWYRP